MRTAIKVVEEDYETVNTTKADIEELKKKNKSMQEKIETNTAEMTEIEQKIKDLTKNINDKQTEQDANDKKLQKLAEKDATPEQQTELDTLNKEISNLKKKLREDNKKKMQNKTTLKKNLKNRENYPKYDTKNTENEVSTKLGKLIENEEDFNTLVDKLKELIADDEVSSNNKLASLKTKLDLLKEISQLEPFNADYVTIASDKGTSFEGSNDSNDKPDFTDLGEDIKKIFNAYVLIHKHKDKYETCITAIGEYETKENTIDKEARRFLGLGCNKEFGEFNNNFDTNISSLLNNILETDNTCKTFTTLKANVIDKIVKFFNDVFSNEIKRMWTKTNTAEKIKIHLNLIKTILDSMLQGNQASRTKMTEFTSSVAMISANNNLPDILTEEVKLTYEIAEFKNFTTEYNEAQKTLKTSFEGDSLLKKLYENLKLFDDFKTVHTIQDGSNPSNLDAEHSQFLQQQTTFKQNLTKIIDAIKCLNDFVLIDIRKKAEAKRIADEQKAAEEKAAAEKAEAERIAAKKAAAAKIVAQRAANAFKQRRSEAERIKKEKEEAAIKIQNAERQRQTKKRLSELKAAEEAERATRSKTKRRSC